jgi:hypothetical protein
MCATFITNQPREHPSFWAIVNKFLQPFLSKHESNPDDGLMKVINTQKQDSSGLACQELLYLSDVSND